jgi:hypothetical protein
MCLLEVADGPCNVLVSHLRYRSCIRKDVRGLPRPSAVVSTTIDSNVPLGVLFITLILNIPASTSSSGGGGVSLITE